MPEDLNKDRRRWYGLCVGDRVEYLCSAVEVVWLHPFDNNGCTVRYEDGSEGKAVCEWCKLSPVRATED